jgi:hypothetical protein
MRVTSKQLMLSVAYSLALVATSISAKTLFDEMIEEMHEMQALFERRLNLINEHIKNGFSYHLDPTVETATITISENKTTNCMDIVVSPISFTDKTIEATMEQDTNMLTVTTPEGTLTIQVDSRLISAQFNQRLKQEFDSKNGAKQQVSMSSLSQSAHYVNHDMALEESRIEYDQTEKKLTVSVPVRKKALTKIPVTVKESPKEAAKAKEK